MIIPVRQCHTIQIRTVIERLGVEWGFQSDCPHDVFKPAVSPLALTSLQIRAEVERLGVQEGFINVLSRHTTTAGAAAWGLCPAAAAHAVHGASTWALAADQPWLLHRRVSLWAAAAGSEGAQRSWPLLCCPPSGLL